jgi:putative endonuclease
MRKPNVHQYAIYMMTNKNKTVLYTGLSNSLERRVWQHKKGAVPGFTKKYNCNRLVYYEIYEQIDQTIAREKQIKGWTRAKKEALISTMNPEWSDLAEDWYTSVTGPSPSSRLRMTDE